MLLSWRGLLTAMEERKKVSPWSTVPGVLKHLSLCPVVWENYTCKGAVGSGCALCAVVYLIGKPAWLLVSLINFGTAEL